MEKIWLSQYPPQVPGEIGPGEHPSLGALFEACARRFAPRTAYECLGGALRFGQWHALSDHFAAWLGGLGLGPGARVAIMLPNVLAYPVALFGALRAGMVVVNVNPQYTARELEYQLRDSGAQVIVILEHFAHVLESVLPRVPVRHVVVASPGDLLGVRGVLIGLVVRHVRRMVPPWRLPGAIRFGAALAAGARAPRPPAAGIGRGDIAFLQYTGGTTGVSKAAILTHGNILANLDQVYAWMAPTLRPEARLLRVVTPLPLYHIFSLTANCLTFMKMGGCNILVPNPRDISGLVRLLGRCRWNVMTGVNTLFNALLQAPGFARLDFSGVIAVVAGGTALQAAVAERWQRVTGVALCEGYGLTETSPVVCANLLGAPRIGTVGLPLPSTEISIRDEAGVELPPGEAGQLWVRGPQVMRGYWNRPDETGPVLSPEGFLATGDIATVDAQGYVRIVDRSKDMISVSGFKVYPNELEDLIAGVPGVAEVACIGVPDPHSGEAVALFVVPRADAPTGPALESALRAHCERHLTGYKRPRHIHFRTQLPKSTVGKILRRALRDEAARGDGA